MNYLKLAQKYDAFEVHPCELLNPGTPDEAYEQCDPHSRDIAVWSFYGHLPTGGIECISDHPTQAEAEKHLRRAEAALRHLQLTTVI